MQALRSAQHIAPRDPLTDLAANAVAALSRRRDSSVPDLGVFPEREVVHHPGTPPRDDYDWLLINEQQWIESHTDQAIAWYVPTLARALAAEASRAIRWSITSEALEQVVVAIVASRPPPQSEGEYSVFDPTCGTASLLLAAARAAGRSALQVSGQDINPNVVAVARAHAFLCDVPNQIVAANSLVEDPFVGWSFDLAVADIPYGLDWRQYENAIHEDPRYPAGPPARNDASLLFAQGLVAKLRPPEEGGGRAVLLCAPAPLVDRSGSRIRDWLLENDLLEGIVALPEGLSAVTNIRLYVLLLNNAKPPNWAGKAQVVDLRGYYAQAPRAEPERRRLSTEGIQYLRKAFEQLRPSPTARPVPLDTFRFGHVEAIHKATEASPPVRGRRGSRGVTLLVGATRNLDEWANERYGIGPQPALQPGREEREVRLDVSSVFPDPAATEAITGIRRLRWPFTRLACLASSVVYVRSARAPERETDIAALSSQGMQLILPVEPHVDALASDTPELAPPNRCFFVVSEDERVDLEFVAAWLNSPSGRTARRAALGMVGGGAGANNVRSLSQSQIWRFLDELVVPVPDRRLQNDLASTQAVVAAASRAIAAANREMWQSPTSYGQIRRRMVRATEPEQLREWCDALPYPLAGALWLFETLKDQVAAAQAQLLRFWEATAEFLSAVFLSVLEREPSLRQSELPQLRRALGRGNLSLERATFGTWTLVVQRLTSVFRNQLASEEPDAAAKLRQLFADPPGDVLERLLDPTIGTTLARVNAMRNNWHGHAGATTEAQFDEQVEELVGVTEELRNALGGVWEEYQLIRAGKMARRAGRFHVDVELATGRVTPFRKDTIQLVEPLDEGRLYLVVLRGEQALPLNQMIVFRAAPRSRQYTSYFYNRREANGLRLVTYQYADENSVVEQGLDVEHLLAAMDQPKVPSTNS
jgi:SAM-dependent methyltransferase